MAGESYEGWSNRETWCLNLWLANDEGLYRTVTDWATELLDDCEEEHESWNTPAEEATYRLASRIKEMADEIKAAVFDGDQVATHEARVMVEDVGSFYRVDYREIAASWIADEVSNRADS